MSFVQIVSNIGILMIVTTIIIRFIRLLFTTNGMRLLILLHPPDPNELTYKQREMNLGMIPHLGSLHQFSGAATLILSPGTYLAILTNLNK